MPANNISIPGNGATWNPDSNRVVSDPLQLLRADNLVPDENNKLSLRRGSETLFNYSQGDDSNVNVIHTTIIDGVQTRFINVGNRVLVQPSGQSATDTGYEFDGTGDIAFGDDAYQAFFARGTTKKRVNSEGTFDWGLPAPTVAPTLAAAQFTATKCMEFGTTETTIAGTVTYPEGTNNGTVSGADGTSNGARSMTPNSGSGRASVCKVFTATQNFSVLNEQAQADTDLFDLYVWLQEPRKVDKITIMFGLNDSSGSKDPFVTDYYYFEFKVKDQVTVDVKDSGSTGAAAYTKAVSKIQSVLSPLEVTQIKTPKQVQETLKRLGRFTGPRSRERVDSTQNSPAWTHFSVTRGQFNRVGGTAGLSWATVTAFKVVYTVVPGSPSDTTAYFDSAYWYGGGDRALTGTYRGVYRFVYDNGVYIEMGPPSPISNPLTVTQGNITFTIPAQGVNEAVRPVNQIWVYLYGGFLDTFYRFAIAASSANARALRIDDFTPPNGSGINTGTERSNMLDVGLGLPGGDTNADKSINISLRKGELDALIDNETLEPGVVGPPNNTLSIAGPWLNRMFCLTTEGYVYPSSDTSPSNFSVWWVLDFRRYGKPLWMVKTNGGIVCGFTKDCVRIVGTGELSEDKASLDFGPEPLGVGQPPVDNMVYTDGTTIVYRSADGPVVLNGANVSYLPTGNTSMMWRGFSRHDISALNLATGRFRAAFDNNIIFACIPEGTGESATAIYRYYVNRQEWCRTTYPSTEIRSIHREPDGTLLIGNSTGDVIQLEINDNDDGAAIPVEFRTGVLDGGQPLNRKRVFDLQLFCNTGGDPATFGWYFEDASTPDGTLTFTTTGDEVYRTDATDIGPFMKGQFRITGSFNTFTLHSLDMLYYLHPQMVMTLDTGYILPSNPGDIAWIQEVELGCIAVNDIDAYIYLDDEYDSTERVTVKPNVNTVYRIQVPQGSKARRPRIIFKSIVTSGVGNVGFEPYTVRIRQRSSGNQVEAEFIPIYPVGQQD